MLTFLLTVFIQAEAASDIASRRPLCGKGMSHQQLNMVYPDGHYLRRSAHIKPISALATGSVASGIGLGDPPRIQARSGCLPLPLPH